KSTPGRQEGGLPRAPNPADLRRRWRRHLASSLSLLARQLRYARSAQVSSHETSRREDFTGPTAARPSPRAVFQPPVTGGITATTSPLERGAPRSTKLSFTAKRTLLKWGASAG